MSFEYEDLFWEKNILCYDTPTSLQRAVFFSTGMQFALRGVQEHHALKIEQLVRYPPEETNILLLWIHWIYIKEQPTSIQGSI